MGDIREDRQKIGIEIQKLAILLIKIPKSRWKELVLIAGRNAVGGKTSMLDMLFIKPKNDIFFRNALQKSFRAELNLTPLMQLREREQAIYNLCLEVGDDWNQLTICVDNQGHFESFFDYPKTGIDSNPFNEANFEQWKRRFLTNQD